MTNKHFICISIKHTYYSNSGWVLWRKNESGYTDSVNMAGLYSPEDFTGEYDNVPVVKMRKDLVKHYYKKYDSVLVDRDEFVNFIADLKKLQKSKRALMWSRPVCIALNAY